mmetsp:Transcript_3962/g.5494  ORF Transcript_3962/g.5494 Transcript_3962/m.5494 type:complete len:226 (+) Transcript_3962:75-752(+)|eukprot:CAMPEP_0170066624 /NCGR_PEP_ID=MMETSP0019_2-20121128/6256_1 /TAXON_ID=98059 /ORGANISM="Dinobryon sp., Strain UTEXLB2267" /LENGTH=225 /DNA_ID=CAMNT_0010273769 /DNA_START=65 /DNA_END=742 /DNA_ORIENTATION=+
MSAYNITDHFNSLEIKSHYHAAKKRALAFLFTIGAKALVLAENDFNNSNCGLNEEAELKKGIINDENVRNIKRNIAKSKEIEVQKVSKRGIRRTLFLKIRQSNQCQGVLVWKSAALKHTKKFILDNTLNIQVLNSKFEYSSLFPSEIEPTASTSLGRGYGESKIDSQFDLLHDFCNNIVLNDNKLPMIRFQNSVRSMDIQFKTLQEVEACLQIIQVCQPHMTFTI